MEVENEEGGDDTFLYPLYWSSGGGISGDLKLVGKLITKKHLNKTTVIGMVRKAWNLREEELEVVDAERNAFVFKFKEEAEMRRVLRGRSWSIMGVLLNIQEWKAFNVFHEIDFDYSYFWIQLHNIPNEAMSYHNAVKLGGRIGEVMAVEDPRRNGRLLRIFMRVRVKINLKQPIVEGFWLPRPDGRRVWVVVKYEKLENFCFKCGCIGHDPRVCNEQKKMSKVNPREARYGNWLATAPVRNWNEAIVYCDNSILLEESKVIENQGSSEEERMEWAGSKGQKVEQGSSSSNRVEPLPKFDTEAEMEMGGEEKDSNVVQEKSLGDDLNMRERSAVEVESSQVVEVMEEGTMVGQSNYFVEAPSYDEAQEGTIVVYSKLEEISIMIEKLRRVNLKREEVEVNSPRKLKKKKTEPEVKVKKNGNAAREGEKGRGGNRGRGRRRNNREGRKKGKEEEPIVLE